MSALPKELRSRLENAVKEARDVAEEGARAALRQLAVDAAEPFAHLSAEARELRNRLRAHARQLGDKRNARGEHEIEHLVTEVAYEQWHRMLFARFLAENHLLMHPDGVPVTLEECEELAKDEGAEDGWELAGRYAARMLPQIFRPGHPALQLKLPPEHQRKLEKILADLATETFTASDSLGWVYQFWQAKKKDEVNRSEVKIGADELPAVTQLFTEPYMVAFLLDNSLGAWWAARRLTAEDLRTAENEDELRRRAALPGMPLTYLRFVRGEAGVWGPAAGTFERWPRALSDLKVLDPCCGSGHFLVAALYMLAAMRIALEGLTVGDAVDAVLRENLHGLEIDERCTQIAAFALALAAWTFPNAGGYRALPDLSVACSGLSPSSKQEAWVDLVGGDTRAANAMKRLHALFASAPLLGSLLVPTAAGGTVFESHFDQVCEAVNRALVSEQSPQRREMAVTAAGIAQAAELLSDTFVLVVTNVPYLGRARQEEVLSSYCAQEFPRGQADLATAMAERCRKFVQAGGTVAAVLPQSWMYLGPYRRFRRDILQKSNLNIVAQLGPGAFRSISGEIVNVSLTVASKVTPSDATKVAGVDVSTGGPEDKAKSLRDRYVIQTKQLDQLENPDSRILLESQSALPLLSDCADSYKGVATGDLNRFVRCFWEVSSNSPRWKFLQTSVSGHTHYGGRSNVVLWDDGRGELFNFVEARLGTGKSGAWLRGGAAWNKEGVAVSQMAGLSCSLYSGDLFDENTAAVIPKRLEDLAPIYCFLRSENFGTEVRRIDSSSLKVPTLTLLKVPFDIATWRQVARDEFPAGLPSALSDDPFEWVFDGAPSGSSCPLHVAAVRLLGYRWPQQVDDGLDDLIDDDGIVCLPAVRGEQPAALRLGQLLARTFGNEWSPNKQAELLAAIGCKGWAMDRWLNEKFFEQHCALFHQRPFVWHIWDGLKRGGFAALVNYHKLDRKLLETLTYNYVGDWIKRQEDGVKSGVDGAAERLDAARALQRKLELILEGEPPYDIFVRWKPIEEQPIGWDPDLNDGVRLNIRPFVEAGVLRKNPKINWNKDRGKDPEDAPWYNLFKGDRINDHHLTLREKRIAREIKGGK
jgi:hypothetical protein